jgi:hypothetical protein
VVDTKILERLDELIALGEEVKKTRYSHSGDGFVYVGDDGVKGEMSHQWGVSCLSLLERVFGKESPYYAKFDALYSDLGDYTPMVQALGIIRAAREDIVKGALFNIRRLVEAEVLDDLLDQAQALLEGGYVAPAAVVAGCVLEDGLRKLCLQQGIVLSAKPKLDQMNSELAKKGAYTKFVQKRVTLLADIRNRAAHGDWADLKRSDVEDMTSKVRSFMEEHFA